MTNKEETYEMLLCQVESLIEGEDNETGVLANVSAALASAMPQFFWTGFYLVKGEELCLGPFQGTVACYRIPYNKGVCGTAWAKRETLVVPDVDAFPGHIACSSLSRSEIVVPLYKADGNVWGVLDIDSKELSAFDETDKKYLEKVTSLLSKHLAK